MDSRERRRREIKRLLAKHGTSRAGHAIFSPSGSSGWLNCDAFALVNAVLPDDGGEDAAYGTVAHEVAAVWLRAIHEEGKERAEHVPTRFLGFQTIENGFHIVIDKVMLHHVRRYIDWCEQVEHLGDVMVEQRVDYSKFSVIPDQGGFADHFVMVARLKLLIITDLKMGIGVPVFADENTQGLGYALGVFLEWDWLYNFQTIRIRICQPRLDYFGEWECSREYLLEFAEKVRAAIDRGWSEHTTRTPGPKQCRWCNDKTCLAKSKLVEDLTSGAFEEAQEYDEETLREHEIFSPLFATPVIKSPLNASTSFLVWRKRHRKMVEDYFRGIDEELLRREGLGEKLIGFKRVSGRRSFKWQDEAKAAVVLMRHGLTRDEVLKTTTISVKQARDGLRAAGLPIPEIKKLLEDDKNPLVAVSWGKPTLAPDTDDRVDFSDDVGDAFGDL